MKASINCSDSNGEYKLIYWIFYSIKYIEFKYKIITVKNYFCCS